MFLRFNFYSLLLFNFFDLSVGQTNKIQTTNGPKRVQKLEGICIQKNCKNLCNSPKIDAVLNYRNGTIYAFKGSYFYEIMNKSQTQSDSNTKIIGKYWNPNNSGIFMGPIDAAFIDDNGYTYLFQNNNIHTFFGFRFIDTQTVNSTTLKKVDSALMVNYTGAFYVYVFSDQYYWKIWKKPNQTRYDWNFMFNTFTQKDIKDLSPKFPVSFDTIFQDNNNDIKVITNFKYKTIPLKNFPNSIEDKHLVETLIYIDLFNCEKDFYERTKFINYDQFIITLLTQQKDETYFYQNFYNKYRYQVRDNVLVNQQNDQDYSSGTTCSYWPKVWIILLLAAVGAILQYLLIYFIKCSQKEWKSSKESPLYTYPKSFQKNFTKNSAIDLIRKQDLICDDFCEHL